MVVGRGRSGTRAKKKRRGDQLWIEMGRTAVPHPPRHACNPTQHHVAHGHWFCRAVPAPPPHLGHSNSSIPHAPALPNVAPRTTPTHPSRTLAPTISSKFCGKVGIFFEKATEMILQKVAKKIAKRKAKKIGAELFLKQLAII